jgi:hypothetical protein
LSFLIAFSVAQLFSIVRPKHGIGTTALLEGCEHVSRCTSHAAVFLSGNGTADPFSMGSFSICGDGFVLF